VRRLNPVRRFVQLLGSRYRRIGSPTPTKIDIKVVSTRCHDGLHVIFWDFDLSLLEPIIVELGVVQSRYGLSNIYVLRTARGYHAVCFAKFRWPSMMRIVADTRYVDRSFLGAILRDMRAGLRYEGGLKPKFVCAMEGRPTNARLQGSTAHRNFFEDVFSFKIEDDLIWDGLDEVQIWHASKYLHRFKMVQIPATAA